MANLTAYYTTSNGVNTPVSGGRNLFYNEANGQLSYKDENGDVANAISGVPSYADNAAALAGGLEPGDLYKTTKTGAITVVAAA